MPLKSVYNILPQTPTTPTMHFTPSVQARTETEILQTTVEESGPFGLSLQQQHDASQKLKRKIRILRLISRVGATALATATLCLEAKTISIFLHTRNVERDGRGPWALQTSLWPSILLASASATTVLIGLAIIAAYTRSIATANKVNLIATTFTIGVEITHVLVWIVVAVLYRKGKTGHDLWGWACSPLAQKIQPNFKSIVDFSKTCQRGETNWVLSVANPAFTIFNLSIWYFVWQRRKYQKLEEELRQREREDKGVASPTPRDYA